MRGQGCWLEFLQFRKCLVHCAPARNSLQTSTRGEQCQQPMSCVWLNPSCIRTASTITMSCAHWGFPTKGDNCIPPSSTSSVVLGDLCEDQALVCLHHRLILFSAKSQMVHTGIPQHGGTCILDQKLKNMFSLTEQESFWECLHEPKKSRWCYSPKRGHGRKAVVSTWAQAPCSPAQKTDSWDKDRKASICRIW